MKALVVLLWHGTSSELGMVGVCGAVQGKQRAAPEPYVSADTYFAQYQLPQQFRLKWELFPMKNDHKSFPFHDFNLAFFRHLDII